jgi:hypothetical protein
MLKEFDPYEYDPRLIASEWHGGQFRPLYALSSSGTIVDGLESEIVECLIFCDYPDEKAKLEWLLKWVEWKNGTT